MKIVGITLAGLLTANLAFAGASITSGWSTGDAVYMFSSGEHECGKGPQIVYVLPKSACKDGRQPGTLHHEGNDRYEWVEPGPSCDADVKHERQAWSDYPECDGAKRLE